MAPSATVPLSSLLASSSALIDQFRASLSSTTPAAVPIQDAPSPIALLEAAAGLLKSQTTKLSLLAITPPLTPSALSTCLQALHESILPSLVTVAMLTVPKSFTESYSSEVSLLVDTAFRDIKLLLGLIDERNRDGMPKSEPAELFKKSINETTGKLWEDCDSLVKLAKGGVAGFIVRKTQQWLELMKDAVKELEEWDPADEVDENSLFEEADSDPESEAEAGEHKADRATISAGVKDQVLKVLSRVPQSIHVVVKQRLEKLSATTPYSQSTNTKLDSILKRTRDISESIDESAEAMYMGDLELCLRKAGEARALTIEVVEMVIPPWPPRENGQMEESKEDKYVKRALDWIQQVQNPANAGSKASSIDAEEQKKK